MIQLKPNSLEAKIFAALSHGPVTLEILQATLRTRKDVLGRKLHNLQEEGLVLAEALPEGTYLSLAHADVEQQAIKPMLTGFKRSSSRPKNELRGYG